MRKGIAAELGGLELTVQPAGALQAARYAVADCPTPRTS